MLIKSSLYKSDKWKILDKNAKSVLLYLTSRANNNGKCFPSRNTIMQDMSIGKRALVDALTTLGCNNTGFSWKARGKTWFDVNYWKCG